MDHPDTIEQRLMALEIKATFTEDLLEQLDQVVVRQQQQIDRLLRELAQLRQAPSADSAGTPRSGHEDLPPHY